MKLDRRHLRQAVLNSLLGLGAIKALKPRARILLIIIFVLYGMAAGVLAAIFDVTGNERSLGLFLILFIAILFIIYDAVVGYLLLERQDFKGEMALAGKIQMGLFPEDIPRFGRWSCGGHHRPARSVGGDYWDVIPLTAGRALLVVGDVAGKGIPAAILMSAFRSHVHLLARQYDDVAEMAGHLNRIVWGETGPAIFATAWIGILDEKQGTLQYVNAGHPPALLVGRDGTVRHLSVGGLPVGVIEEAEYTPETVRWQAGDRLVIYSDGVLDVAAESEGSLEPEDLVPAIREAGDSTEAILAGILEFVQGQTRGEPDDDLTLLVCRFGEGAEKAL